MLHALRLSVLEESGRKVASFPVFITSLWLRSAPTLNRFFEASLRWQHKLSSGSCHNYCRSTFGSRATLDDLEGGDVEKPIKQSRSRNQSLVSGIAYCISSCGMILLNKTVLSGYGLKGGISLMFYQVMVTASCFLLFMVLFVCLPSAPDLFVLRFLWTLGWGDFSLQFSFDHLTSLSYLLFGEVHWLVSDSH